MQPLRTVNRLIALALAVFAAGSLWRRWRRPEEEKVSREVELLRQLAKDKRA